jgi:hypothetical protein
MDSRYSLLLIWISLIAISWGVNMLANDLHKIVQTMEVQILDDNH